TGRTGKSCPGPGGAALKRRAAPAAALSHTRSRTMTRLPLLLAVAFLATARPAAAAEEPLAFLQKAVFEGLRADGAPLAVARALADNNDNFLGKCPLCAAVRDGLQQYAALAEQPRGNGLTPDLQNRLLDKDPKVRFPALRELVGRYVERGYAGGLTAEDRDAIKKKLQEMHGAPKGGNQGLNYCPSCDGACQVPPKRRAFLSR